MNGVLALCITEYVWRAAHQNHMPAPAQSCKLLYRVKELLGRENARLTSKQELKLNSVP